MCEKRKNELTKGEMEACISEVIIKFEKEYMGRGPEETKTYIIKDMIFIRLNGVLTKAEKKLSENIEGRMLVKQTRARLLEDSRELLENAVQKITNCKVISMHTDISTKKGERIIVFILNKDLEEKIDPSLKKKKL